MLTCDRCGFKWPYRPTDALCKAKLPDGTRCDGRLRPLEDFDDLRKLERENAELREELRHARWVIDSYTARKGAVERIDEVLSPKPERAP